MTRAEKLELREAAKRIYEIIERAEAGLPEAERAARWERFMAASEGVAARCEKRPKPRRTPATRAASHGR